jgi:hypothetical protein
VKGAIQDKERGANFISRAKEAKGRKYHLAGTISKRGRKSSSRHKYQGTPKQA